MVLGEGPSRVRLLSEGGQLKKLVERI